MQRRSFLKTAAASAFGACALSSVAFAQETGKRIPISVQLYSVRNIASKDVSAAFKKIAEIGYEGVEFAGYYGKDPKELRKMLDDNGLKCSGTHTGLGAFNDDNFNKTVDIHKTLGTRFMIIPANGEYVKSVDENKKFADQLNALAEKVKTVDMEIGYHAHGFDAKPIGDVPAWEMLFDATVPTVIHQMDLGNYQSGGGDPYGMIEKFKGRSKTVHLKENGPGIIGTGKVDWKKAFEVCETIGGTEWYVVEDEKGADAFDRIEACFKALKEMGKTK